MKFNEGASNIIGNGKKQLWPLIVEDNSEESEGFSTEDDESLDKEPSSQPTPNLRDRSSLRPPNRYQCQSVKAEEHMALCYELEELATYIESMSGENAKKWQIAIKEELNALAENNTWKCANYHLLGRRARPNGCSKLRETKTEIQINTRPGSLKSLKASYNKKESIIARPLLSLHDTNRFGYC